MSKDKKSIIEVQGAAITVLSQKEDDYICITDIARFKNVGSHRRPRTELAPQSQHGRISRYLGETQQPEF